MKITVLMHALFKELGKHGDIECTITNNDEITWLSNIELEVISAENNPSMHEEMKRLGRKFVNIQLSSHADSD